MAGTLRVGGKVLAIHDSGTDEISLDSATNTSNMSFDANHAGIKTALNASGDAPIYACRAWVNFDGTNSFSPNPSTSAIQDSGNVSSIYQTAGGDFTVNFTVDMPNANYCVLITGETPPSGANLMSVGQVISKGTSSIRFETQASHNYVNYNLSNINMVVFS